MTEMEDKPMLEALKKRRSGLKIMIDLGNPEDVEIEGEGEMGDKPPVDQKGTDLAPDYMADAGSPDIMEDEGMEIELPGKLGKRAMENMKKRKKV